MSNKQRQIAEGYTVLPLKVDASSEATHHIYIKQHSTKIPDETRPSDRTLFVLNVPPFASKECLERLFGQCGKVEAVYLHKKPTSKAITETKTDSFTAVQPSLGYKVAYVVFKHNSSLEKSLSLSFRYNFILFSTDYPPLTGMEKWVKEYGSHYIQEDTLQKEINTFMENYDQKQAEEIQRSKDLDGVPDDEGWVTVTRHSSNKGLSRTDVAEKKALAKDKKKRKEKELLNFYAFQERETKRNHIAQLRQKFEEDKLKVSQMKDARKFKPY